MVKYISFIRGINVSGKNEVSMQDLKKLYGELGFSNVSTYINSGNVLFESPLINPARVTKLIVEGLKNSLGLNLKITVLPKEELSSYIKTNPLSKKDSSFVHFTILFDKPQEIFLDYLNKFKSPGEEFFIIGRVVYLYCPNGYGKTKLNNNFFENKLNVNATTRNYNTIKKLVEMI